MSRCRAVLVSFALLIALVFLVGGVRSDGGNPPPVDLDGDALPSTWTTSPDRGFKAADGGGDALVTLYFDSSHHQDLEEYLEENDADILSKGDDYMEVEVSAGLSARLSKRPGVWAVIPTEETITAQLDSSTPASPSVGHHNADSWHQLGFKGRDIKIGVIDSAYDHATEIIGDTFPETFALRCWNGGSYISDIAKCEEVLSGKHGTAVTETIFDIAPEAEYYLATASSKGQVREVTEWMVEEGVQVINYSMNNRWDGPGDGTSPFGDSLLNTIDYAVENGVLWVGAAGNSSREMYYTNDVQDTDEDNLLNFGDTECINTKVGRRLKVYLRWGDSWTSPSQLLRLYLFSYKTDGSVDVTQPLGYSNQLLPPNSRVNPAMQVLSVRFERPILKGCLAVRVNPASDGLPPWIQIWGDVDGTLYPSSELGHLGSAAESVNQGAITVGAATWDAESASPGKVKGYSSRGPVPAHSSVKPDIAGMGSTTTKSLGSVDGTSIASPHVTGLVALLLQRYPRLTPQEIKQKLLDSAWVVGDAPDYHWGYGFARMPDYDGPEPPASLSATATDPWSVTVSYELPAQPADVYIRDMYLERLDADEEVEWSTTVESDFYGDEATQWEEENYGLEPETTYRYRVRLESEYRGRIWSDVVSATTPEDLTKAPTGLKATLDGTTVSLSWTVPEQPEWVEAVSMEVRREYGVEGFSDRGSYGRLAGRVSWQDGVETYDFEDTELKRGFTYHYRVRMYVGQREHLSETVQVEIPADDTAEERPDPGPLSRFAIVETSGSWVWYSLRDGDTVALPDPDNATYGIAVYLQGHESAGSVRLELDGAKTVSRTENLKPYSLYGDYKEDGERKLHGESLPAGEYTIRATAYSEKRLGGDELGVLEYSFTITAQEE